VVNYAASVFITEVCMHIYYMGIYAVNTNIYFTVARGTSRLLPRQPAVEIVEIDIACRVKLHGIRCTGRHFAVVFAY
jgi:hypothetical protein